MSTPTNDEPASHATTNATTDATTTEASEASGDVGAAVVEGAGDEVRFSDRVWSHPWMGAFLDALAVMPVAAQAARQAGIGRQWAFKQRLADPEFAAAWEEARKRGVDLLEQNSWRWATVGVEVTETTTIRDGSGRVVKEITSTRTDRNSQIAMMMLKAHRPEYRDQAKLELTGAGGGPIQHEVDRMPSRERMVELAKIARDMEIEGELVREEDEAAELAELES